MKNLINFLKFMYAHRVFCVYLFLGALIIYLVYRESLFTNAKSATFYFDKKENAYKHFIFFEKDSICDSVVIRDIDVKTTGTITTPDGKILDYHDYKIPISNWIYEPKIIGDSIEILIYEEEGSNIVDTNALYMILPVEMYSHGHIVEKDLVRVYEKNFKIKKI